MFPNSIGFDHLIAVTKMLTSMVVSLWFLEIVVAVVVTNSKLHCCFGRRIYILFSFFKHHSSLP